MKIVIQGYWNAEVKTLEYPKDSDEKANQRIAEGKPIMVCDIIIDGKHVGSVNWNGKELFIEKEQNIATT